MKGSTLMGSSTFATGVWEVVVIFHFLLSTLILIPAPVDAVFVLHLSLVMRKESQIIDKVEIIDLHHGCPNNENIQFFLPDAVVLMI